MKSWQYWATSWGSTHRRATPLSIAACATAAASASAGSISGSGFARAKTMGCGPMDCTMAGERMPGADTPTKISAPASASEPTTSLFRVGESRQLFLDSRHASQTWVQDTNAIYQQEFAQSPPQQQLSCRGACGPGSHEDSCHLLFRFVHQAQCVHDAGKDHDGGPVLVIMDHRDIEHLAQPFFHLEAAGGSDIFQVDPTKGRGNPLHRSDNLIHILRL